VPGLAHTADGSDQKGGAAIGARGVNQKLKTENRFLEQFSSQGGKK
jgi:hypothetical protein